MLAQPSFTAAQRIIAKANAKGSSATTVKGAIAYLLSHLPSPIAGLAHVTDPTNHRRCESFSDRNTWDKKISWTHDERAEKRASAISARVLNKYPRLPFAKARSFCRKQTPDIVERVTKQVGIVIGKRLAVFLANAWPYRYSESRWAGGEHNVNVQIGTGPRASCSTYRVWSRNGKWSGTNSDANLTISARCYEALGTNLTIGGLITLDCEEVDAREYRATWAEQSKGLALKVVDGWIVRGYHVGGGTLEAARRKAENARRDRLATLQVAKLKLTDVDLSQVLVTRTDSIRAGNCTAGTTSFINRHGNVLDGRKDIPADELLKIANDNYTRAAVLRAVVRTLAEGRLEGVALADEGEGGASAASPANDALEVALAA